MIHIRLNSFPFAMNVLSMANGADPDSPRARNRFNQVVEAKRFEVCSYVEQCAEFKNQTLKKIGWYTKVLCATEYPRGMQYLKEALKWGYPCRFIL